jgi:hypothetical protein
MVDSVTGRCFDEIPRFMAGAPLASDRHARKAAEGYYSSMGGTPFAPARACS